MRALVSPDPLWTRSPFVLRHFPGLLVATAVGALLLAGSLALGPLYLSATASSALHASLTSIGPYGSGFFMQRRETLDRFDRNLRVVARNRFVHQTTTLARATAGMPGLGPVVTTMMSMPLGASAGRASTALRLMARTGAAGHVRIEAGSPHGFLVPDTAAHDLHLRPGDRLTLRFDSSGQSPGLSGLTPGMHRVSVRVSGIYRDLVFDTSNPYWANLIHEIRAPSPMAPPPPPFVIGSQSAVTHLLRRLGQTTVDLRWEVPVSMHPPPTYDGARAAARDLHSLIERLSDPQTRLGATFRCGAACFFTTASVSTEAAGLTGQLQQVDARLTALRPPVTAISGAGALVALAVIASAGVYGARRRRDEMLLLLSRGWRPRSIALRAVLESVLPLAAGAAAGYGLALVGAGLLAPSARTDPSAAAASLARIGVALPLALAALATVTLMAARALLHPRGADVERRGRLPWEVVVAAGAIATYVVAGRGRISFAGGGATEATYLLLGFPLLALVAGATMVARAARRGLARLTPSAEALRPAPFLALSRLGASTGVAITLLVAAATSLGLFAYAQAMVASLETTTQAKASVFTGGDAAVAVDAGYRPPSGFRLPASKLYQITSAATLQGAGPVGVLAINPSSFARAARWNDAFSGTSLSDILKRLEAPGQSLPYVAVGDPPPAGGHTLDVQGAAVAVTPVATAAAFPGIFGDTPWVVVAQGPFARAVQAAGGTDPLSLAAAPQLIVRGERAEAALRGAGFSGSDILTAQRILQQPTYVAAQSTLRVLRALGVGAALLSVLALLLYLQVRQRERVVAAALAARMGLRPREHLLAVAGEVGAILVLAAAVALAGGYALTALTHSWIDTVPSVPPAPLLVLPLVLIPALLAGAIAVAFAGAWIAQRSGRSARLSEEMRRVG